jgi:uncharacterized protein (DUF2132 family)
MCNSRLQNTVPNPLAGVVVDTFVHNHQAVQAHWTQEVSRMVLQCFATGYSIDPMGYNPNDPLDGADLEHAIATLRPSDQTSGGRV